MGLTIHWDLEAGNITAREARAKVDALRTAAERLPFAKVGPVHSLRGSACKDEANGDEELRWLLIQAGQYIKEPHPANAHAYHSVDVRPKSLIAFSITVGDGCEQANFGLCRYPATVTCNGKRFRTHLPGWRWASFCKTQYASDPECGGVQNFLKCHLSVVALLRRAEEMGLVAEVRDEGDYWDKGDVAALVKEIGEWNNMIAAFAGQLKDALGESGMELQAPILARQDFEHLEAAGQQPG